MLPKQEKWGEASVQLICTWIHGSLYKSLYRLFFPFSTDNQKEKEKVTGATHV